MVRVDYRIAPADGIGALAVIRPDRRAGRQWSTKPIGRPLAALVGMSCRTGQLARPTRAGYLAALLGVRKVRRIMAEIIRPGRSEEHMVADPQCARCKQPIGTQDGST